MRFFRMNGALVAAVFRAQNSTKGGIRPGDGESDDEEIASEGGPSGQAVDNPLANVNIPRKHLVAMFVIALVSSIISAFVFTASLVFLFE